MPESSQTNIQDNIVKFTGSLSVSEPLKVDTCYRVGIDVEVYEGAKRSRQNGEYDFIFKSRIVGGEILKDNGEILRAKDNKSWSKKIRDKTFALGEDYEIIAPLIFNNLEQIIQDYKYNL